MANNPLAKSFSKWRVLIPVFIGLAIASWMIYQSVKRTTFIKVEANTGNYKWIDSSGNKTIDIHDESDFIAVPQGDYNLESFNSILASIDWGFQVWFWLLMAFVFMIGRDLFYIIRIRILTKGELSWRRSFIVIMLWEFALGSG